MDITKSNTALVHDWFLYNSFSGSEKVTLSIDKFLSKNLSQPDLFSLVENISSHNNKIFNGSFC